VTLQIVASLIDAARGIIYDRHMFIVQATEHTYTCPPHAHTQTHKEREREREREINLNEYNINFHILWSALFFIKNDAEIWCAHYTSKVAFANCFHKQIIQVKL
jgi:hypothetical protein